MSICQACGETVPDTAKFCRNCGAPLATAERATSQQAPNSREQTVLLDEEPESVRYEAPKPQRYHEARSQYQPPASVVYDHTNEFDPKDISENKVVAMLIYLMGFMGIIIALLKSSTSPYAEFHVRQGLKFVAINCLIIIVEIVLGWFLLIGGGLGTMGALTGYDYGMNLGSGFGGVGAFVGFIMFLFAVVAIFGIVLYIIKIICFFSICKGRAKEPPIVRSMPFLK